MAQARIDIVVNDQSISSLESKLSALQAEIKGVGVGSNEFKKLSAEIRQTEKALAGANQQIQGLDIATLAGNFAKAASGVGAAFAVINLAVADNEEASETARVAQEALISILGLAAVAEGVLAAAEIARTVVLGKETQAQLQSTAALNEDTVATVGNAAAKEALAAATAKLAFAEASLAEAQTISGEAVEVAEGLVADATKGVKEAEAAMGGAAAATKSFGSSAKALAANLGRFLISPVGIAIAALGALVLVLKQINDEMSEARIVSRYGTSIDNLSEKVESASGGFDSLTQKIAAYASGLEAGILNGDKLTQVQDELKEAALQAGLSLQDVNDIINSGTDALTIYIAKLPELLKAQVIFEALKEQVSELVKIQNDPSLSDPGFWQSAGNAVLSAGNAWSYAFRQTTTAAENYAESTSDITTEIEKLQKLLAESLKENSDYFDKLFGTGKDGDGGGGGVPARVTDISNEILKLQRDFVTQTIKSTSEGYDEEEKLAEQARQNAIEDLNRRREEVRKDATISRAQKKLFLQAAKDEEERIELEYREKLKDIDDRRLQDEQDALKEGTEVLQESLQERLDLNQEYNDLQEEQEQIALKKRLLAGEVTEAEYEQELLDIRKKFLEREEQQRSDAIVSSREALLKEILALQDDESEEGKKRREELQNQVTQTYIEEDKLAREFTNKYADLENERVEATKEANEEIVEDTKKTNEEKAEAFAEYVQGITDLLVGVLEFGIIGIQSQIELLNIETQSQIEQLDKSLENTQKNFDARQKQINQSTVLSAKARENAILQLEEQRAAEEARIAKQKEKLEKDAAKKGLILESKQAKANLAIGIARAISEAAIGISTATAQAPLTFGASLALIAPIAASLAAAIASYSAQEKSIDAQVSALGFAEGGFVSGPGSGSSDSVPARLSNGEFVINAASTANNLPLLEEINSTGATNSSMTAVLNELRGEIEALRSQPVKAYVVTSELDEASRTDAYITRRAQL